MALFSNNYDRTIIARIFCSVLGVLGICMFDIFILFTCSVLSKRLLYLYRIGMYDNMYRRSEYFKFCYLPEFRSATCRYLFRNLSVEHESFTHSVEQKLFFGRYVCDMEPTNSKYSLQRIIVITMEHSFVHKKDTFSIHTISGL